MEKTVRVAEKTKNLNEATQKFPHLAKYIEEQQKKNIHPEFYEELNRDMSSMETPNLIYPVGDPIFIHIYREKGKETHYNVIEPEMTEEDEVLYNKIMDLMIEVVDQEKVPDDVSQIEEILKSLFDKVTQIGGGGLGFLSVDKKVKVTKVQYDMLKYYLIRDRVGYGKLEALLYDPNLEDIHCTGVGAITTIHKVFDLVHTSIIFDDDKSLNKYIIDVTERVERPVSDARPVVDAIMPDGSRSNVIYGREVSLEGSSFTLRKFSSTPVSITQIINWGTISLDLAAYLWLAMENGMNMFVCGETASGKTTTLNGLCVFIKPDAKIYTVENTPEVTMPHKVWQHLVTREAGKDSDVTYLDLLIAALRSRPNYIIVGEIRGEEGAIAFQAMQTGHPVLSTFHAGNVTAMIQRVTGDPINIPITSVDNLNLCLIQMAVFRDNKPLRRVLSLTELERYYEPANKMITREVFTWDGVHDEHVFRGMFNSYILEQKIAKSLGYDDPRRIYSEMELRAKILKRMIEEEIFDYFAVWDVIRNYFHGGAETLPFEL
ncbi:MAG: type II/IV secretion system ATPase subunit [Candidatus Woesearchaeota archaeon]|nr:type II/IV secretion system ATPase subunit [Candidatus Woesearchaeota archaeon]